MCTFVPSKKELSFTLKKELYKKFPMSWQQYQVSTGCKGVSHTGTGLWCLLDVFCMGPASCEEPGLSASDDPSGGSWASWHCAPPEDICGNSAQHRTVQRYEHRFRETRWEAILINNERITWCTDRGCWLHNGSIQLVFYMDVERLQLRNARVDSSPNRKYHDEIQCFK